MSKEKPTEFWSLDLLDMETLTFNLAMMSLDGSSLNLQMLNSWPFSEKNPKIQDKNT